MDRSLTLFQATFAGTLFALGCGAGAHPAAAPAAGASAAPPSGPPKEGGAHALIVAATACWSGGPWSEAMGAQGDQKTPVDEARCRRVERDVWAGAEDKAHFEQLRALEANAVADVIGKVDELAKSKGLDRARRDALVRLAGAIADEQKELMLARRAAQRVKRDLDHEPEKLSADEVDAVGPLRATDKLKVLMNFDDAALAHEAHALSVLGALDRVELARGLPKHLKLYAAGDAFRLFFGVKVPDVPRDATRKLVPGTWLAFLSDTAKAAGHPVSPKAQTPKEKDAVAWAGMLEGFHDKLAPDVEALPPDTELGHVATVVLHRLEEEFRARQGAEESLHK